MRRALVSSWILTLVAAMFGIVITAAPASAATLTEVTNFGSNPGQLRMFQYVPAGLPANSALVVLMHGCGQTAAGIDDESGWTGLADVYKFLLVLPQSDDNNKCFGPGNADTTRGGGGDADSIKQMVDWEKAHRSVNNARVFATGFSSGAMMTNVMLGAYPDVFSAGGALAGIPYRCAVDLVSQTTCGFGRNLTPQQWGDRARAANPGPWVWPRMVIVHGTADPAVDYMNLTEEMEQWTNLNGIDQVADVSDYVNGYPHKVYKNAAGQARVETYSITGSGHNILADAGTRPGQCGKPSTLSLVFDVNFCAAYWIGRFFGVVTGAVPSRTLVNDAALDGTVKAWAGNISPTVATDETGGLQVGRASDLKLSRAILSVDTSAIPDNAVIGRAWLFITKQSTHGDPFNDPVGNVIQIDVRTGCLGGSCATQTSDWNAASTAGSVASIARPGSSVDWSTDFSAAGRAAINKTGITQLRLRFRWDQFLAQNIYVGNGSKARLVVEY